MSVESWIFQKHQGGMLDSLVFSEEKNAYYIAHLLSIPEQLISMFLKSNSKISAFFPTGEFQRLYWRLCHFDPRLN
jgi:hypothetical protein